MVARKEMSSLWYSVFIRLSIFDSDNSEQNKGDRSETVSKARLLYTQQVLTLGGLLTRFKQIKRSERAGLVESADFCYWL